MPKTFVVVPREGRGLITSRPPYLLDDKIDSFSAMTNVVLADGAWASRLQDFATTTPGGAGVMWAIHGANAKDPSAPASSPVAIGPFYLVGGNVNGTGTSQLWRADTAAQVPVGGTNVTCTDPHEIYFLNIKDRVFFTGSVMNTVPGIITKFPTATSYKWGVSAATNDLTYDAYNAATNAVTKQLFQAAGAAVTASTTVTAVAGTFTTGTAWKGKTIVINGNEEYTIRSVTDATHLELVTSYTGTAGTYDWLVRYGNLSWGEVPPKYAFAYYDPVTGHMSNISPQLTFSEKNISNVWVNLQGIQCTGDARFTRIAIFRTQISQSGSALYPLYLDPTNGGTATFPGTADGMILNTGTGSVSYRDYLDDNKLTLLGGVLTEAPTLNNPPPTDAKFGVYWDQKVWLISAATPYRIAYSGDSSQVSIGVTEECFPFKNTLDLASEEGRFTGMKIIGNQIILCTERSLYTVSGSGANYRLVRVSSRGTGVDNSAIAEHPGDTSTASASVIYLSIEGRLWRQYQDGKIIDIGEPIQDKLDLLDGSLRRPAFVNVFQLGKNWICAVGIRSGNTRYNTYFLDLDKNTWMDWGYAGAGFVWNIWSGSLFGSGAFTPSGYAILTRNDGSGSGKFDYLSLYGTSSYYASQTMTTQQMDFGDRVAKKTIQAINLYVNIPTEAWGMAVELDGAGGMITLNKDAISGTPRAAGPHIIRFNMSTLGAKQFHCVQLQITYPTSFSGRPRWYKYEIVYDSASTEEAGNNN